MLPMSVVTIALSGIARSSSLKARRGAIGSSSDDDHASFSDAHSAFRPAISASRSSRSATDATSRFFSRDRISRRGSCVAVDGDRDVMHQAEHSLIDINLDDLSGFSLRHVPWLANLGIARICARSARR